MSGCSSVAQAIPLFTIEDNSKEIWRNKIHAFLVSLTLESITDQIIADYVWLAKSKEFCSSLDMANLANDVLPTRIANDEWFGSAMIKVKQEHLNISLGEYYDGLQPWQKVGHFGATQQEFDYKS